MAIRYVRTNGADGTGGHDGTTPALAWLTLGYAMTNVAAGDTIWVGAGTYRVSAAIAPTSMGSMTYCYGDTDGSKTGDAGEILVTNYTSDTAAAAACHTFSFVTKNFWTLGRMTIMNGGTAYKPIYVEAGSHDLTFQDLTLLGLANSFGWQGPTWNVAWNLVMERCRMMGALYIEMASSASGADLNLNSVIRNCSIVNANAGIYVSGAANTFKSGGLVIANCFLAGSDAALAALYVSNVSTTYKVSIYNSILSTSGGGKGIYSSVASQVTEDYNFYIGSGTALTNVTKGANTINDFSRAFQYSLGHEQSFGATVRSLGMFPAGSPFLGWGSSGSVTVTDDIAGGPRPGSGAASVAKSIGPFERSNSATKETGTVRTGSNAIKIAGPGYQEFVLPVASGVSTTVSVYARWDSTYAGTKPSLVVRNGGECGVADATVTATGSANNWEQLASAFTPTSDGIVTIRLVSSDTNGGGAAFFDDFAVA